MQRKRKSGKNSVRLLMFFLFLQTSVLSLVANEVEVTVKNKTSEIDKIVSVEVFILKENVKDILKENNELKLDSKNEFETISYSLKETPNSLEAKFEIKLKTLGENYFIILLNGVEIYNFEKPITAVQPELNTETEFLWKVFENEKKEITSKLEQGKKYFLVLYGAFLTEQTKITKIEYSKSSSCILEKNDNLDLQKDDFTQILSFNLIPLHYEEIFLPEVNIFYTDASQTENKVTVPTKILKAYEPVLKQLEIQKAKTTVNDDDEKTIYFSTSEIECAKKIYNLRNDLKKNIFQIEKLKELRKLEQSLKIQNTFLPGLNFLFLAIAIIVFFVSIILIIKFKFKNIAMNIFYFVLATAMMFFVYASFKSYGVIFSSETVYIKNIPENDSKLISELQLGQTVHVKKALPDWCLIETSNNLKGWVKTESILLIK